MGLYSGFSLSEDQSGFHVYSTRQASCWAVAFLQRATHQSPFYLGAMCFQDLPRMGFKCSMDLTHRNPISVCVRELCVYVFVCVCFCRQFLIYVSLIQGVHIFASWRRDFLQVGNLNMVCSVCSQDGWQISVHTWYSSMEFCHPYPILMLMIPIKRPSKPWNSHSYHQSKAGKQEITNTY